MMRQLTPPVLPMAEMILTENFGENIPKKVKLGFEALIERSEFDQSKRTKLN